MTKISQALSADQIAHYFKRDLAGSAERSYFAAGVANGEGGQYWGAGAEALGLIGKTVDEETIRRLALGQSPTGVQLIEHRIRVSKEPEVIDNADWRKHLEEKLGVKAEVLKAAPQRAWVSTDGWEASQIPMRQLWRDLGGPEIKGKRSTAFWRGGDGLSVSIDAEKGVWHDFVAGEGGGTIKLAATVLGISTSEAARYLREQYRPGVATPITPRTAEAKEVAAVPLDPERRAALIEMHRIARDLFQQNLVSQSGAGARMYLAERGIKPETWAQFGVGLASPGEHQLADKLKPYGRDLMIESGLLVFRDGEFHDRFRDRLMFPIENAAGETIAFAGRKPPGSDNSAKYVNSPSSVLFNKGDELYGLSRAQAKIQETGKAVVVEGYLDVLASTQSGVATVGSSGTAFTDAQAASLAQYAKTAILNFDADDAGKLATEKAVVKLLDAGMTVRVASTEPDPAEFVKKGGAKAYRKEIRKAVPLVEYLSRHAKEKENGAQWMLSVLEHVPADQRASIAAQLEIRYPADNVPANEKEKQHMEHRGGYDLCLSAPKTVSISGLVGQDSRVVSAHQEAAMEAYAYAERGIQVKMGGLNPPETTGKAVFILFQHDVSRPVDGYSAPNLHFHGVLVNMSPDANGQFRSLNPKELFYMQSAVEAVYQNSLGLKLKRLGYELEVGAGQAIEIAGYTQEYRDAESPRTLEIEAEKKRIGRYGPEADQYIALSTREAKLNQTPEEVKAMHREHAAKFGHQADRVVAEAKERRSVTYSPEYRAKQADGAIQFAKAKLSARTTVMEDHEVHREALRKGRGFIALPDVEAAFARAQQRGEFIEVHHWREYAPGSRWTTPELQRKERYILGWMAQGRGKMGAMSDITRQEFREQFHTHLNDGQKWLVFKAIHSVDRMVGIQGLAGTGKTTALAVLGGFAEAYGFEVRGVAATTAAVAELQHVGIKAETLAAFLVREEKPTRPRAYFMDEASLTDVHQSSAFLSRLLPADRVFVIGDVHQHASLGAGAMFSELQQAGMETYNLKRIVRQRPESYREVVKKLARGDIEGALQDLKDQGRIHVYPNERERFAAISEAYLNTGPKTLVVSPDNHSIAQIGQAIREVRQESGDLGANACRARILRQRGDVTDADSKFAPAYRKGDVIEYRRDSKVGIRKGDRASVLDVDRDKNKVTVMREEDGQVFTYDPARTASAATLHEPLERHFAVGDRIQFTKPFKGVAANGERGTIERLDDAGNVRVRLDKKDKVVVFSLEKHGHVDLGYASTSHRAQSMTADNVIGHMDTDSSGRGLLSREMAYVMVSRGRDDFQLFANTDDVQELTRALSRSEEKSTALNREQIESFRPVGVSR